MPDSFPLVDIHCHLIAGIDDGADDLEQSLAMARMAAADGITTVVATPHQLGAFGQNRGDTIRAKCRELQVLLDANRVGLQVLPGADVRIEPEMLACVRAGDVLTLADRRRHVLLELPHELYLPLGGLLEEMRRAGLVGILSHPERNLGILEQPRVVDSLVDAGCLMQVTAGSLIGAFGNRIRRAAERFVSDGLVHFLATDAHGPKSRRPLLRRSMGRLVELAGEEAARELCCDNPGRVAAGEDVSGGRRSWRVRRGGWFRKRRVA